MRNIKFDTNLLIFNLVFANCKNLGNLEIFVKNVK